LVALNNTVAIRETAKAGARTRKLNLFDSWMKMMSPITLLFDIDGTLMRAGGAGLKAIGQVMNEMFGASQSIEMRVHGRTDNGILTEIFETHSLSFDEHRDEFSQRYWDRLPETLNESPAVILPGVSSLLDECHRRDDISMGILTGNSKRAAEIKLQHFGIEHFFEFGGYGDFHSSRNDVAALARSSAESFLGARFEPSTLWVIGDTVNDITCARSIEANVVAVETGGGSRQELAQAKPDLQFESFEDHASFVSQVTAVRRSV
jgi:phosphoglycolate phosphatase